MELCMVLIELVESSSEMVNKIKFCGKMKETII
jgi:hypothetical protein